MLDHFGYDFKQSRQCLQKRILFDLLVVFVYNSSKTANKCRPSSTILFTRCLYRSREQHNQIGTLVLGNSSYGGSIAVTQSHALVRIAT
jgi:hypothetical protein